VYGVDVERRRAIPADAVSRLKAEYRAMGGERSNAAYGWVRS
jgi:hypothetical protein